MKPETANELFLSIRHPAALLAAADARGDRKAIVVASILREGRYMRYINYSGRLAVRVCNARRER
jgi:hypothetical protein